VTDRAADGAAAELTPEGLVALRPGNDCDREPIHLSGAIQPHGFLVAVDPGSLTVQVVSANLSQFVPRTPARALDRTLGDLVGAGLAERVCALASTTDLSEAGPLTVELPAPAEPSRDPGARQPAGRRFELVLHRSGDLLVLEFEPAEVISDEGLLGFDQATNRAMNRMHDRDDVAGLCETAVTELRRLTGYDRVMVYRFDQCRDASRRPARGCVPGASGG
jgi:light-regulated signal transduction histidine kinase (bacteriophytochrome)